MTTPPAPPPPGWYSNPSGGGGRRYWDGSAWGPLEPDLEQPEPSSSVGQPREKPPQKHPPNPVQKWWQDSSLAKKALVLVVAGGLLIALLSVAGRTQQQKSCPLPPTVGELRDSRSNLSFSDLASEWNEAGRVGQEVRDGKFAFVVAEIDACMGQPVKVTMTVTNTSDVPWTFSADDQVLLREPPRPTGEVPKGGFGCSRCDGEGKDLNISPGDSVATVVLFDIRGEYPAITAVELHDSGLSMGVKVFP